MADNKVPSDEEHHIYFVRHGESRGNATGEDIKPEDNHLTDLGKKQAQAAGKHFQKGGVQFTKIFSSHYPRALDTAKGILEGTDTAHTQGQVTVDPRLQEREGLSGEAWTNFQKQVAQGGKIYEIDFHPEQDSAPLFIQRVKSFIKDLFDTLRNQDSKEAVRSSNTLVICHGITLKGMMDGIIDGIFSDVVIIQEEGGWKTSGFPWATVNTAITKVSVQLGQNAVEPGRITFHEVNSVHHLAHV